jgi:hypothetical protein
MPLHRLEPRVHAVLGWKNPRAAANQPFSP